MAIQYDKTTLRGFARRIAPLTVHLCPATKNRVVGFSVPNAPSLEAFDDYEGHERAVYADACDLETLARILAGERKAEAERIATRLQVLAASPLGNSETERVLRNAADQILREHGEQ